MSVTLPGLTRQQCRELDRRASAEYGISSIVLMENAGRGVVDVLEKIGINGPLVIVCGKGNNAGDGFVIARHLEIRGHVCRVLLLCPQQEFSGDAASNFAILRRTAVPIVEFSSPVASQFDSERFGDALDDADWLVDAMLGTGAKGEPRSPFNLAIAQMNARAAKTRIMAVDVPSGLDCDTGEPATHTIRAHHTCTFAAMKLGFNESAAKPYVGNIHICDIGVPPRLIAEIVRTR